MTTIRVPAAPVTALRQARMASAGGDAKTSPTTAAASIPLPTYPLCAGSCPDPPPAAAVFSSAAHQWVPMVDSFSCAVYGEAADDCRDFRITEAEHVMIVWGYFICHLALLTMHY